MLPSLAGPQLNERIDEELAREAAHCQTSKRDWLGRQQLQHSSYSHRPFFTASAIAPFADDIN